MSAKRPTGMISSPVFLEHDTGPGHVERPERLQAIFAALGRSGLINDIEPGEAQPVAADHVLAVHTAEHVELVREAVKRARKEGRAAIDADTVVSERSLVAALSAVGAALAAGDAVVSGRWKNAFCAVRPPGHHAETSRAMGFCLFNNAALLARDLQEKHDIERVAVLDWDVHHGNGTQQIFESDPTVLYVSMHQSPHWPGTGSAGERGIGDGEGATLNLPLAPGTGDAEWLAALEKSALPAIADFRPGAIVISAGFDAHERDPLSSTRVTTDGYRAMTRAVVACAESVAGGKLISLLEGGYELSALGESVLAHLEELHAAPR
jgi:acetoin utilization deacetylase AcuC-like enzyme